jgi:hypothetical protein
MHVDPLALETPREIQVAPEHVTRIDLLGIPRVGRITVPTVERTRIQIVPHN